MQAQNPSYLSAQGTIFVYNNYGSIAYRSTPPIPSYPARKYLLFLDGMTGNLLSIPYFLLLLKYCQQNGLTLVYPQLRSHPDFTVHVIEEDLEDIEAILGVLQGEVVMIGHSTGCQDSLLFLGKQKEKEKEKKEGEGKGQILKGIILQAPVSDIEAYDDPDREQNIAKAKTCGKYIIVDEQVWLSQRYLTVNQPHNKQDLFSSYLSDQQFQSWKDKKVPILTVLSGKDEYCHKDMREKFLLMGKVEVLEKANHAIMEMEEQKKFIGIVDKFLREIGFVGG